MPTGRYRLAALLLLRTVEERGAAAALASALAALEREEAELSGRDVSLRERRGEAAGTARAAAGRTGQALQWTARALVRLRGEIRELALGREAQRAQVEQAVERTALARDRLEAARAGRRGIEMHRERWEAGRRWARQAALEAEQDDRAPAGPRADPHDQRRSKT